MKRLEGKTAMITGAAGGTGRASAKLFAEEGAHVLALDVNEPWLKTLDEEVKQAGGDILVRRCDVTDPAQIKEAVEAAVAKWGTIDVLFNNVGGTPKDDGDVLSITPEKWQFAVKLNAESPLWCTQAVLPYMIRQKHGSIIFTETGAAEMGDLQTSAYAIAKGSVNVLYKYVATQYGRLGIRSNMIIPGLVMNEKMQQVPIEYLQGAIDQATLGVAGYPIDLARAALFFASDESSYITGARLACDGGMSCHMPTYLDTLRGAASVEASTRKAADSR